MNLDVTHYSLRAFNELLRLRREKKINWRAVVLGSVIAGFAHKSTGKAWPARGTLSAVTGISPRHISTTIRELEQAGFLMVEKREGHSNLYRLTLDSNGTPAVSAPLTETAGTLDVLVSKPLTETAPITMKNNKVTMERKHNPRNVEKPHTPKVAFKDGAFTIPDEIRTAWEAAYPHADIDAELAKAAVWLITNGQGKKDYGRFLTNWLSRSERWRQEREGPAEPEYTEEQLEHNRRLGEELMAEELRRHELGIPDWEECPA